MSKITETDQLIRQMSSQIATLRGRFQVQLKLAGEETADRLEHAESLLQDIIEKAEGFKESLETKADEAELQAYLGLQQLADRVSIVTSKIDNFFDQAGKISDKTKLEVELAELRLEIEKLDAEEFIQAKRKSLKKAMKENKDQVIDGMLNVLSTVNQKVTHVIDRL